MQVRTNVRMPETHAMVQKKWTPDAKDRCTTAFWIAQDTCKGNDEQKSDCVVKFENAIKACGHVNELNEWGDYMDMACDFKKSMSKFAPTNKVDWGNFDAWVIDENDVLHIC